MRVGAQSYCNLLGRVQWIALDSLLFFFSLLFLFKGKRGRIDLGERGGGWEERREEKLRLEYNI